MENQNRQPLAATDQGNGQPNNASQGLSSNQQAGSTGTTPQPDQANTYRGQGGQEYDVDADDALNHKPADAPEIETVTPETESAEEEAKDKDMESNRDTDQHVSPGDKAPNKEFNR
ncbi:hypothetical protein [Emticicia sp. 21SJ11W-3]|uniref:hypothetical protein n=1 Tax=Emticicia sp. 21SJ11W-3 TaxID=2916755 RepID=UPI00209DC65C|nr:hypothetical protein [Emticicia sp. 21SJ11W-3]UTA66580.1 hypothetical protein MB380_13315 [Emticicia sp. 21SJ11W-3]